MITKILKTILLFVVIFLLAVVAYFYLKLPQRSGEMVLGGLDSEVQITFDNYGVPHIEAENNRDLFYALGYVHAQDRLFQMEITRRLAQGQLAEILGDDLISVDKLFRRLSIHHFSKQWQQEIQTNAPKEMLDEIDQYLAGVNAFAVENRPSEFDILGIPTHHYEFEDILSIAGYMSWSFAQATKEDPIVEYIILKYGNSYLEDLGYRANDFTRTIPTTPLTEKQLANLAGLAQSVPGIPPFIGSNGWALAGDRTSTGAPLFSNDPHIGFSQPSVWYEAHLKSPQLELYGHHLSLVPFALLGHNKDLAWGLTMFENDDIDLYRELQNPDNENQYWLVDRWTEYGIRQEEIQVKGQSPEIFTIKSTVHGPLIQDSISTLESAEQPISLKWQFLQSGNRLLEAFWTLPKADQIEEAYESASLIHAPGLNLMYANSTGDIAWFAAAKLPKRPANVNSKRILDGASGNEEWLGYYPFSENPMAINPDSGFVYSANNQPEANSEGFYPGYYAPRDRADRINAWMIGSAKHDTNSMKLMLLDSKSATANILINLLKEALGEFADVEDKEKKLALKLYNWDTSHDISAIEPTLYNRFRGFLQQAIFEDELGAGLYHDFKSTFLLDRSLWMLANNKDSFWWDNVNQEGVQDRNDIVKAAWLNAIAQLELDLGEDPDQWQWSKASQLTHQHPLGQVEPLNKIFNVGPFPANGGVEVINNLSIDYEGFPFAVGHGPSTRRIIDFSNPGKSLGIIPTGQSGVVFDKHYKDQAQLYVDGMFRYQYMDRKDIDANSEDVLVLMPKQ